MQFDGHVLCKHRSTQAQRFALPSSCSPSQSNAMKIRARVTLSGKWRSIALSIYLAILCGLMLSPLFAQFDDQGTCRRTSRGWEYAHAVQASFDSSRITPSQNAESSLGSTMGRCHSYALPIAVSSFFVTFGCWLLIGVPNRGIIRRLY